MMYQRIDKMPACGSWLHPPALRLLCYCLFLLLASCASSSGSTGTSQPATPTQTTPPTPAATPTPAEPVLSTAQVTYKGHSKGVLDVAWSPDGKRLASASDDGTLQVWNTIGKTLWSTQIDRFAFAVAWSPDGKLIAGA